MVDSDPGSISDQLIAQFFYVGIGFSAIFDTVLLPYTAYQQINKGDIELKRRD